MRSNEEFKAEVLERSRKAIKERKRNIKIALSCCIPLALCLVLIFPLNSMTKNGMAQDNSANNPMEELFDGIVRVEKEESLENSDEGEAGSSIGGVIIGTADKEITSFSVSSYTDNTDTREFTDKDLCEKLYNELKAARNANVGLYSYELINEEKLEGKKIVFTFYDGNTQEFVLIENRLYVDNVLYEIKDEYVANIEYILENSLSLASS